MLEIVTFEFRGPVKLAWSGGVYPRRDNPGGSSNRAVICGRVLTRPIRAACAAFIAGAAFTGAAFVARGGAPAFAAAARRGWFPAAGLLLGLRVTRFSLGKNKGAAGGPRSSCLSRCTRPRRD